MKSLIFALTLIFSSFAFSSQSIDCSIQEFGGGETFEQKLEVVLNPADPHGSMQFFKLQKHTDYQGFIALVKEFAVISIQTPDGAYSFTSQGNVMKGEFASLQVLVPSEDLEPAGILITCSLTNP